MPFYIKRTFLTFITGTVKSFKSKTRGNVLKFKDLKLTLRRFILKKILKLV